MIRVAVFPSGSEVAIEVSRALSSSRDVILFGIGSIADYGDAAFVDNYSEMPMYNESNFIEAMASYVADNKIDFIIPGMDEVGYTLKKAEATVGCEVVYAELSVAEVIRKKSSTYKRLADIVPVPRVYDYDQLDESVDFPLFLKPDVGYGSRGARKLGSAQDLQNLDETEINGGIFTEYLPGEELTVDCFSDLEGQPLFFGPRRRVRVRMGISVTSEPVVLNEEIEKLGYSISSCLKLTGCWFFQVKRSRGGNFKLLEVAGRVAGSSALYRLLGINFILLDLYQRLGMSITIPSLIEGNFRMERALDTRMVGQLGFDDVYIDFDDCMIIKDKVNCRLAAFIFYCRNEGKSVSLITRHSGNLDHALNKYGLKGLFDEVFHIKDGSPKSAYISSPKALFIDDSFSEREEVSRAVNCAVAGPDMIDIGWFLG